MIANTGTYDTAHSVHLTREARRLGVARLPGRHAVLQQAAGRGHLRATSRAIAAAADGLPVIVYNIPQRVILNLEPALLARLARESANVVAVKQATTDLDQARRILDAGPRALRRQRRPARAVPRARRRPAASASPRTSSAPTCCACASSPRPATSRACARSTASWRRCYEALSVTDQSDPAQGGARAARAPRRRAAAAAGRGDRRASAPCCAPPLRREA